MTDYSTFEKPAPLVDEISAPFWEAAAQGQLSIQRCAGCQAFIFPAALTCSSCGSVDLAFEGVSGFGRIYAVATMRQALHAGFVAEVPFVLAMIQLEESPELLMISNVVGASVDDAAIGDRVEVGFEDRGSYCLPVFHLA